MKRLITAGAMALGLFASASAANAALYNLHDHRAGGLASQFEYGLRLDARSNPRTAADFWSFETEDDVSLAKLNVNVGAGTGFVTGQMRNNDDDALWDLSLALTGISAIGTDGSFGATGYTGTLTNGTETLDILGKQKTSIGFAWTLFLSDPSTHFPGVNTDFRAPNIAAGWVASIDGGASMLSGGANDFLAEVSVVPLPAGLVLLLTGVGVLGIAKRRSLTTA
ncbi:MAG: VPLPA-CTERM sorting domain-containing protein [Pseudomonadota bacterium]